MNPNKPTFRNVPISLCLLVNRDRSRNLAVCQDTASKQPDVAYGDSTTVDTLSALKILKTGLAMTFGCLDLNRAGTLMIRPHPSLPTPGEY